MTTFTVTNGNDSGVGSLRQAVLDANANAGIDTIEFDVDLVTLESAIDITDSVDVNGNVATVKQTGVDRIFNINDNSDTLLDVSLNGLTLTGGRPEELGGAVYTLENLVVDESVFRDNVTSLRGGGIYSDGGNLTITNSLFEQNEVVGEFTTSSGGAFYIDGGILTVDNSSFVNNKSFAQIASIGKNNQSTIANSLFDNNNGGAIFVGFDSVANINTVKINNNFNQISGAGIGIEVDSQVVINNSIIKNNQSEYGAGILVSTDNTLEVNNSEIASNTANQSGGGFLIADSSSVTIKNSSVTGNSSPVGSAIEVYDSYSSAFIVDTTISGNTGGEQLEGSNIRFGGGNVGGILEPVIEEPVDETPVVEEPVVEEPVVVEPTPETPVVVEPVTETPVVEEPTIEEPVIEPTPETPVVEEPITETPVVEEPVMDESNFNLTEVHRFYQYEKGFHFYTADDNESQSIQTQFLAGELKYNYENAAFSALANNTDALTGETIEGAQEVYRFYNNDTGAHLFTMDENEKAHIQDTLDNYSFEGTAYYAFESEVEGLDTIPVYRMLNGSTGTHLFSADANEVNYLQDNEPQFTTEGNGGVAFYVFEF